MNREITGRRGPSRGLVQLVFVAVVTCWLIALVFTEIQSGLGGAPGVLVYGLTAGFGLEYVRTVWPSLM